MNGKPGTKNAVIEAVDLFCGVGGLTLGLQRAGIVVKCGYDLDTACEFPYEENTGVEFIQQDVSKLTAESVAAHFSEGAIRLLVGCAPCQTFSTYTRGPRAAKPDDERWSLLDHFGRIVKDVLPDLVSMENVPRAKGFRAFTNFVEGLETLGYDVWYDVVDCATIGAPQARRRLVLIASRLGPPEAPKPIREPRTVRDVIGHLPPVKAGFAHPDDPLHYSSALSEKNLKRMDATPAGGDWRNWPDDLKLECHKKESGRTYRGVYGRMRWDSPAPTLTTLCGGIGNGRFGHPDQRRGISLREAALLQTFPAHFKLTRDNERVKPRVAARLIGNAVPPLLGEAIGLSLVAASFLETSTSY